MVICYPVMKKRVEDPESACYVSTKTIKKIKKYLELAEDFCKVFDYNIELFVINAPYGAIDPLLPYSKDSEVYINTCRKIAATLRSKKGVTKKAVISFMGIVPKAPPLKRTIELNPIVPRLVLKNSKTSEISAINQGLIALLETPQIQSLRNIMERDSLENEYTALIRAITHEERGVWSKK